MISQTVSVDLLDYIVRYWVLIVAIVGFIWHSARLTQIVSVVTETQNKIADMVAEHETKISISETKIKNLEREAFKSSAT